MNQQQHQPQPRKSKILEGLRAGDLQDMISPIFTVDQFKSKMGEDKDVVVLAFKCKEKMPAIDLMEFLEKGYQFILDADMSTGEERDGQYSVFVELERNDQVPKQIIEMLDGVAKLTNCLDWEFRYFRNPNLYTVNEINLSTNIPLSEELYNLESKKQEIKDFFDQGAIDVELEEDNSLTFKKPFSGNLLAKLDSIGNYSFIKTLLPGKIDLDESSLSQVSFLEKYLGNYEIHKINNKFLIRNGTQALIMEKDIW